MYKKRRILDNSDYDNFRRRNGTNSMSENVEEYTGIVHYRESNIIHSPPGYDLKKATKRFSLKEKICLKEGSLFNMCLKFMTINIDLIDSLVGMPEIIGEQLFSYMIKEKIFNFEISKDGSLSANDLFKVRKLAVFGEAYNDLILKSLTLDGVPLNFNFMPLICNFQFIVELDLSGRKLPSELFSIVATFACLEKLILQDTKLTDECVTKLTLPYRIYKENPQSLEIVDIKNNKNVSNGSLELLLNFKNLKLLNLTGTSVSLNFELVYELKQFGWQISRDEPTYSYPINSGWAEPIISFLRQKNEINEYEPKTKIFYSKPSKDNATICVNDTLLILIWTDYIKKSVKFKTNGLNKSEQRKLIHGNKTKKKSVPCTKKTLPLNDQNFFNMEHEETDNLFDQYSGKSSPEKLFNSLDFL